MTENEKILSALVHVIMKDHDEGKILSDNPLGYLCTFANGYLRKIDIPFSLVYQQLEKIYFYILENQLNEKKKGA